VASTLGELPDLPSVRARVEGALRGAPDTVVTAAVDALAILDARAEAARKAAAGESIDGASKRRLDLTVLAKYADDQFLAAERQVELRDHESQRKIMARLAELQARAALVEAGATVTEHVDGLRGLGEIDAAIAKLNTSRISHKLRELQELAITERLRKAVENELQELDPVAGRIEITGQASKGETVIRLKLREPCRAKVGNVFSDGEQRGLSLAFFLAEVAVSEGRSAIVLDDPVSSLDHDRRVYIANRLAAEAKRRQVIVFTHDMPFVHLMQEATRDAGAEIHGQTLQRAFHRVGMVSDALPTKMLGTAAQLRTLEHRLRYELIPLHKRQDPHYEQEADRWVWDLRKAYEQLIVDKVFNGSVRPFNAHIRVRNLHDVKWTPEIAKRIDKGMKEASPKAHREPLELHPRPFTPPELTGMLHELTTLHAELGAKPDALLALAPPEDTAEQMVIRSTQSQSSA
jgi:ABC-type transport system involved in cytochrome c biogenesis ATPase subunit